MKWLPDPTGRFQWRPYYDQSELDSECERLVTSFLKRKYGECRFPLSTDDLSVMIEQDASDLDLYADLTVEGPDVEGLTEFFTNKKPAVKIARELSLASRMNGRLRTTLAHEYGHVKFHTFLWELSPPCQKFTSGVLGRIPAQRRKYERFRESALARFTTIENSCPSSTTNLGLKATLKCTRRQVLDAPYSDWMEWQASYVSGAILMPLSFIRNLVRTEFGECGRWLPGDSDSAGDMISHVAEFFDVSSDAARVRLEKLGFLQNIEPSPARPALASI